MFLLLVIFANYTFKIETGNMMLRLYPPADDKLRITIRYLQELIDKVEITPLKRHEGLMDLTILIKPAMLINAKF